MLPFERRSVGRDGNIHRMRENYTGESDHITSTGTQTLFPVSLQTVMCSGGIVKLVSLKSIFV